MEWNICKSGLNNVSNATLCSYNGSLSVWLEFVQASDLNAEAAVDTEIRKTSPVQKHRRVVLP